jgi:hypothetical protein
MSDGQLAQTCAEVGIASTDPSRQGMLQALGDFLRDYNHPRAASVNTANPLAGRQLGHVGTLKEMPDGSWQVTHPDAATSHIPPALSQQPQPQPQHHHHHHRTWCTAMAR